MTPSQINTSTTFRELKDAFTPPREGYDYSIDPAVCRLRDLITNADCHLDTPEYFGYTFARPLGQLHSTRVVLCMEWKWQVSDGAVVNGVVFLPIDAGGCLILNESEPSCRFKILVDTLGENRQSQKIVDEAYAFSHDLTLGQLAVEVVDVYRSTKQRFLEWVCP